MRWLALPLLATLALPAAAQPLGPAAPVDPVQKTLKRVFPAVVKIYGAGGFTGVPGYGTGVIVHERGFVLTTWSIALKTDGLKFVTHDGKRYAAEIWKTDPGLGVALLRAKKVINAQFRALRLDESGTLKAGETILGIGNPFGIIYGKETPAVMRGMVSAVASPRARGARVLRLPAGLKRVILTDIPNNPGTQGGPVVTLDGRFVGILGRLVESRSTNTILNFAVPADAIKAFVAKGVEAERAQKRPPPPLAPSRRRAQFDLGLRLQRAHLVRSPLAYVEGVLANSAAAKAGIKPDDLLFRLGKRVIRSCRDWDEALGAAPRGETIKVVIKRGKVMKTLELAIPAATKDAK